MKKLTNWLKNFFSKKKINQHIHFDYGELEKRVAAEIASCPKCELLTHSQNSFGPPLVCEKHMFEQLNKKKKLNKVPDFKFEDYEYSKMLKKINNGCQHKELAPHYRNPDLKVCGGCGRIID